jgi:hypothetical protein
MPSIIERLIGQRQRMVLAALSAAVGLAGAGLAADHNEGAMTPSRSAGIYAGTSSELPVQFRYPAAWSLREERGKDQPYTQVRIKGPRNAEDTYTAYLAVTAFPKKTQGGKHETLDEMAAAYLRQLYRDSRVLSDDPRQVADLPGRDILVAINIPPLHHRDLKPLPIPVKTRKVMIERGERLYEFVYSADARAYDEHAAAFEELLRSVQWQEQ